MKNKLFLGILLGLILLVIITGCSNDKKFEKKAEELYNEALILQEQGKYDEAIEKLKIIKMNYPNNKYWDSCHQQIRELESEKLYVQAADHYREKNIGEAVMLLEEIIDKYNDTKKYKFAVRDLNTPAIADQ